MRKVFPIVLLALSSAGGLSYAYYSHLKHMRDNAVRNDALHAQSFALDNGLSVELVTGGCGDSAALVMVLAVGADHDPPGQSGMAHLVERILALPVSAERAKLTVESGSDHIGYSVVAPAERLFAELDVIAQKLSRFELSDSDLQTARRQVLHEIAQRSGGDPGLTATTYAVEAIHPSRGNGRRGGLSNEVNTIDRAAVEKFWRAHVAPANARLVIVGGFEPARVRAHVEKAFATVPGGTRPALRPPGESTVIGTLVMGDAPAAVAMAVPAPEPSDPAYPAFLVLAARLIGEASGPRGWAASFDPFGVPQTLFVTGPVRPGEGAEPAALRIIADASKVVARPLAPADVSAARQRFALLLGLGALDPKACRQDPRALAIAHARRAQLGLEKLELARALDATSPKQLSAAAEHFDRERVTTVIAGGAIR